MEEAEHDGMDRTRPSGRERDVPARDVPARDIQGEIVGERPAGRIGVDVATDAREERLSQAHAREEGWDVPGTYGGHRAAQPDGLPQQQPPEQHRDDRHDEGLAVGEGWSGGGDHPRERREPEQRGRSGER